MQINYKVTAATMRTRMSIKWPLDNKRTLKAETFKFRQCNRLF